MKKTKTKQNAKRTITLLTPKSHLKLLRDFCDKKRTADSLGKLRDEFVLKKQELLKKQSDFKNGAIPDMPTIEGMFHLSIAAYDMSIRNLDAELLPTRNLNEIEKTLKAKGYETRKIYTQYRKAYGFDEMLESIAEQ